MDKVSKLEEEQLDKVQGGIFTELFLIAIPFIATGIGYGIVALENKIMNKR